MCTYTIQQNDSFFDYELEMNSRLLCKSPALLLRKNKKKDLRVSKPYLHGTPAHGEHVEQGDGLHMSPFPATGLGTFALDILKALVWSFSLSLWVLKEWR